MKNKSERYFVVTIHGNRGATWDLRDRRELTYHFQLLDNFLPENAMWELSRFIKKGEINKPFRVKSDDGFGIMVIRTH